MAATARLSRPAARLIRPGRPLPSSRASFFGLPTPPSPFSSPTPAILTASRQLPYASDALYAIIADVDAYSSFLPYCQRSRVTAWRTATASPPSSSPAGSEGGTQPQRWPTAGDLTVGWGPFTESYSSRLYCIPGRVVEAVSGNGEPSITAEEAAQWGLDLEREKRRPVASSGASGLFESLVTRWTVVPAASAAMGHEQATHVALNIRYRFFSPMYQAATSHMADEVAMLMIQAFEKRAGDLLGGKRSY